jgi:hypothetical protein
MAYEQSVRDDYRRPVEVREHPPRRSYLPLAILAVVALAVALWAMNRNRAHENVRTREAPMVTPDNRPAPTTTPSTTPRY